MTTEKRRGTYDADLQQFYEPGRVNIDALAFLRWAVAQGRIDGDGYSNHSAMMLDVPTCEQRDVRCGICELCRGTEP